MPRKTTTPRSIAPRRAPYVVLVIVVVVAIVDSSLATARSLSHARVAESKGWSRNGLLVLQVVGFGLFADDYNQLTKNTTFFREFGNLLSARAARVGVNVTANRMSRDGSAGGGAPIRSGRYGVRPRHPRDISC